MQIVIILFKSFFSAETCKSFLSIDTNYKTDMKELCSVKWFNMEENGELLTEEEKEKFQRIIEENENKLANDDTDVFQTRRKDENLINPEEYSQKVQDEEDSLRYNLMDDPSKYGFNNQNEDERNYNEDDLDPEFQEKFQNINLNMNLNMNINNTNNNINNFSQIQNLNNSEDMSLLNSINKMNQFNNMNQNMPILQGLENMNNLNNMGIIKKLKDKKLLKLTLSNLAKKNVKCIDYETKIYFNFFNAYLNELDEEGKSEVYDEFINAPESQKFYMVIKNILDKMRNIN